KFCKIYPRSGDSGFFCVLTAILIYDMIPASNDPLVGGTVFSKESGKGGSTWLFWKHLDRIWHLHGNGCWTMCGTLTCFSALPLSFFRGETRKASGHGCLR